MKTDIAICSQLTPQNKTRSASTVGRNKSYVVLEHKIGRTDQNFVCIRSTVKLKTKEEQNEK